MNKTSKLSRTIRAFAAAMGMVMLGAVAAPVAGHAQGNASSAQAIANHFSSVRTMTGEFVQFGPSGEQTGGKFYIERPGKVRFDYEAPSNVQVISDGTSLVVQNRKLQTADVYPLGKTPLKLLLDRQIDLSGSKVQSVKQDDELTTIKLADKSVFGDSTITMMFDSKSYELRQWTITDAQGKDTTVMIFNVQNGVSFDPSTFAIDYRKVNQMNRRRN